MAGRYGDLYHLDDRESNASSLLGSFDENDNYGTNSGRRFSIVPPEGNRPFAYSEVDVTDLEDFDPMGEKKTSCIGNQCEKITKKIKKAVKSIKKKLTKKKGGRRTRKRRKRKRTRKRKKKRRRRRRSRK